MRAGSPPGGLPGAAGGLPRAAGGLPRAGTSAVLLLSRSISAGGPPSPAPPWRLPPSHSTSRPRGASPDPPGPPGRPGPGRGAAVPTCGGRAGAASPGPASGSRRHGYGCTSAVRGPPAPTDPDGRTRGCGPRAPPHRETDTAPRMRVGAHRHACGHCRPSAHTHPRHPHPHEVQGHPSAPTRVPSNPSPDTFLCPHNYNGALHPGFALSFRQQVPALPSQHFQIQTLSLHPIPAPPYPHSIPASPSLSQPSHFTHPR